MMKTIILGIALAGLAWGPAAAADLSIDDDFPIVGKGQAVTVSGVDGVDDLMLWVVYSPNSETQTKKEIGRFTSAGTITWIPTRFGIATLSARNGEGESIATENVAILFAKTPVAGLLVMIFAGILLFGSAAFSLWSVLSSGVPEHGSPIDT